jgi:hypothetical protein
MTSEVECFCLIEVSINITSNCAAFIQASELTYDTNKIRNYIQCLVLNISPVHALNSLCDLRCLNTAARCYYLNSNFIGSRSQKTSSFLSLTSSNEMSYQFTVPDTGYSQAKML